MAWTTDTLEKFSRITGFDYTQFVTDFFNFNENKKQKVFDYYENLSELDGAAFAELDRLRKEVKSAINQAKLNSESFERFDDWELFEELENISRKLNTIFNSSKFLRSPISTGNLTSSPLVEITLKNGQTLERLASDLNSENPQEDWANIFLNNQLKEEDYTFDGGTLLKVTLQGANPLLFNSVVDNIDSDEKTYGKDLQARFDFENDDLKVLTYKDTLLQSAKILTELRKNSNPEFPNQGIDASIAVGSTYGSLTFPALFRQIYQNFTTDDSFKSFSITNASFEQGSLVLSYQVQTRSGEIQDGTLSI